VARTASANRPEAVPPASAPLAPRFLTPSGLMFRMCLRRDAYSEGPASSGCRTVSGTASRVAHARCQSAMHQARSPSVAVAPNFTCAPRGAPISSLKLRTSRLLGTLRALIVTVLSCARNCDTDATADKVVPKLAMLRLPQFAGENERNHAHEPSKRAATGIFALAQQQGRGIVAVGRPIVDFDHAATCSSARRR
jgi:hypothetical protein